jgi:phospholipase/lecithinase/hemolysin
MPSYLIRFLRAAPLLSVLASSAYASSFSNIYAFGDSLSDVGNDFIASAHTIPGPPYANGQFSNGPVWVKDLAASLGLPPITASLAGGTDYAFGGAISGNLPFLSAGFGDLPYQLSTFKTANPNFAANGNGLYTIWIGANDLSDIPTTATKAQIATDLKAIVTNVDTAISTLATDGAKNFLVVTVPDLGKTPEAIANGPKGVAAASLLSAEFDIGLTSSLSAFSADPFLNLKVLDTYSLVDSIVAQPGKFGLTDVTDPCLTGEVLYSGGTPCANPNQYLFWDQLHPTAAGHAIVAADAFQVLAPEPASITLLGVGILSLFAARRRSRVV